MKTALPEPSVLQPRRDSRSARSSQALPKVLVYATGPLGQRLAGPEIRALQFARALSSDYQVRLMAQRPDACVHEGFPVVPSSREQLIREAIRNDIIVSPCLPPYLFVLKSLLGFAAVSDKYDPHDVELVAAGADRHERELRLRRLSMAVDLRCADVVLCAGDHQRKNLIHAGRELERPGHPLDFDPVVVPFGIPDPVPPSDRRPLRQHFPQIRDDDKIVLWWGAVWKWLDAETPIRAFAALASSRPDLKLVITAGTPPNPNNQRFDAVTDARELARQLGVIDRNVLFLDEWIPYDQRWDYLHEADLGLTLHRSAAEAELAVRSRYMDYLSAALPCVLGRGDQTAAEFEAAGFATLVDHPSPESLAEIITALLDDGPGLTAAADAGKRLAAGSHVEVAAERLRAAVALACCKGAVQPGARGLALARAAGLYYARKLADELLA